MVVGGYGESLRKFRGNLLKALIGRNYAVTACAPEASVLTKNFLKSISVEYHNIPLERTSLNPFQDFCTFIALARLFIKKSPNVILAYTAKAIIYSGLALQLKKIAAQTTYKPNFIALVTGLGSIFIGQKEKSIKNKILHGLVKTLYRCALRDVRCVVFQNPEDQKYFQDCGIVKASQKTVNVAGSGVDLEIFKPHAIYPKPVFLMIARLLGDKGVREYVRAARFVRQNHPEAIFQLVGGIDKNPTSISANELKEWINEQIIEYLGEVEDVRAALAKCRFYVLPSYREGLPRSVLEAMAMGRPILTTDVPGCRETVRHGKNGILVPPRDWQALASAMVRLLNQTEAVTLKMAEQSLILAKEKFDVRLVNAELIKIVES